MKNPAIFVAGLRAIRLALALRRVVGRTVLIEHAFQRFVNTSTVARGGLDKEQT